MGIFDASDAGFIAQPHHHVYRKFALHRNDVQACGYSSFRYPGMREVSTTRNTRSAFTIASFGDVDGRMQSIGSWHSAEANDTSLRGDYGCSGAIIYTEFREDMFHVTLDGLFADAEGGGDLLVAVAPRHKRQYLNFASGEA